MIEKTKEDIDRLGSRDVILKGDGEPAEMEMLEYVVQARDAPSVVPSLSVYDPQANGAA